MIRKMFRKSSAYETYHYITIRDNININNTKRLPLNSYNDLKHYLIKQDKTKDVFITKYPTDKIIKTIILDFDNPDKEEAYHEAKTLQSYLQQYELNSFIVDSTNKGYHVYIQIPIRGFNIQGLTNANLLFNTFVDLIINNKEFNFKSLDEVNTHAGLGGNIRLINSIHPKTGERVKIIDGKYKQNKHYYKPFSKAYVYIDDCMKKAYSLIEKQLEKQTIINQVSNDETDLTSIDLKTLMQELFNLDKVREYNGAIWCCCPFHNDNSPSFCITEDFYFCASCNAKGNIFTLMKKGYWSPKVYSVSKGGFV